MPMTRSRTKKPVAHDENDTNDAEPNGEAEGAGVAEAEPQDTVTIIEGHLSGLVKNMKTLQREMRALRKRNEELEEELTNAKEDIENASQPKRGAKAKVGARELQKKVNELKGQVKVLEKAHMKDKKKIAKLKASEIKRDALDLHDDAEYEVGDSADKMRKLLRRFHDTMVANALETDEECAICMCPMEVGKAISFPCEHTFCEDCTKQLDGDHEMIRCPSCRKEAARDDLEVVEHTATTQWDELLTIATRWAKMDRRRDMDTSEEEAEEEAEQGFIDDATTETKSAVSEVPPTNPLESSPEPEANGAEGEQPVSAPQASRVTRRITSPGEGVASTSGAHEDQNEGEEEDALSEPELPTGSQPGYSQFSPMEKRRRMEELAEARTLKKLRR